MTAIQNVMKQVMVITEAIGESDLFRNTSQVFLQELGEAGEIQTFNPGDIICRANDKARYVYQLLEGQIDIMITKKKTIHFAVDRPGEIFGWSALVEPYIYTATARCNSPAKVLRLSRESVERLIVKYPSDGLAILRHLTSIISQRLRNAYLYIYNKG